MQSRVTDWTLVGIGVITVLTLVQAKQIRSARSDIDALLELVMLREQR